MQANYKKLIVWQKAMDLSLFVYQVTQKFPKEELYGLLSQMRRCAVSVPSNIAEGAERNGDGEFRQFLGIAKASCAELETQSLISLKLNLLASDDYGKISSLIIEITKMIVTLIKNKK